MWEKSTLAIHAIYANGVSERHRKHYGILAQHCRRRHVLDVYMLITLEAMV